MSNNIISEKEEKKKQQFSEQNLNLNYLSSEYVTNSSKWMNQLPNDMYVSEPNIPGSHQTMSFYPYFGLSVTICQTLTLQDQLQLGLRCFDIRVKQDLNKDIPLYHENAFQHAYFESNVINVMENFLKDHPTEGLIMMIRVELVDEGSMSFREMFDIIAKKKPNLFLFTETIPKIKDIRGKIWVWSGTNWEYDGFRIDEKKKQNILTRQDEYDTYADNKKDFIIKHDKQAVLNLQDRKEGKKIYLNQLNGNIWWYKWPAGYASIMNKYVFENNIHQGLILFDFPDDSHILRVINSNFTPIYTPNYGHNIPLAPPVNSNNSLKKNLK